MTASKFEFDKLVELLGRSENDPELRSFFGQAISNIKRNEYYGFLEFKREGVDAVFNEAPWVLPPAKITDPKELYLIAFHFHCEGHESHAGYDSQLPNGVAFGDSESEVLRKMGQPAERGGGNMFPVLNRPVPYWLRYKLGDVTLRFQLDSNGQVDMATLAEPDINQSSGV